MKNLISKIGHLTKKQISAVYGVVVAALFTIIQSNVLGSGTTTAQKILGFITVFGAAVGIRSTLPPKS